MFFREGILLHLDKQAYGLIVPTGTFRIWRAVWADLGHDPTQNGGQGEPDAAYKQTMAV